MTKAKPPIDTAAETLTPIPPAPESGDVPMPSAENAPPCFFKPGNGVTTTDVVEIALMYLLQLTNGTKEFPKGALRMLSMEADRVGLLSDSAARWLQPTAEQPPTA